MSFCYISAWTATLPSLRVYQREILAQYQSHRTKLLPKRKGSPPTHALKIHYNPLPVKVELRTLHESRSDLSDFQFDPSLTIVQNDPARDHILVYTEFYGNHSQTASVFCATSIWELKGPATAM